MMTAIIWTVVMVIDVEDGVGGRATRDIEATRRRTTMVTYLTTVSEGGWAPRRMPSTGGSGPARVRGTLSRQYSTGETAEGTVSNEG